MMPNSRPATGHPHVTLWSRLGRIARAKTVIAACLLSSVAFLGEPQVAQARNGVNGFVAGAILGGALGGLSGHRVYRGSRTYRRSAVRHYRGGSRHRDRDRDRENTAQDAPLEKAAKGGTVIDTTAGGSAASGSASSTTAISGATPASAAASESAGSSARSSRRNGRRGSGGLETVKGGLD